MKFTISELIKYSSSFVYISQILRCYPIDYIFRLSLHTDYNCANFPYLIHFSKFINFECTTQGLLSISSKCSKFVQLMPERRNILNYSSQLSLKLLNTFLKHLIMNLQPFCNLQQPSEYIHISEISHAVNSEWH